MSLAYQGGDGANFAYPELVPHSPKPGGCSTGTFSPKSFRCSQKGKKAWKRKKKHSNLSNPGVSPFLNLTTSGGIPCKLIDSEEALGSAVAAAVSGAAVLVEAAEKRFQERAAACLAQREAVDVIDAKTPLERKPRQKAYSAPFCLDVVQTNTTLISQSAVECMNASPKPSLSSSHAKSTVPETSNSAQEARKVVVRYLEGYIERLHRFAPSPPSPPRDKNFTSPIPFTDWNQLGENVNRSSSSGATANPPRMSGTSANHTVMHSPAFSATSMNGVSSPYPVLNSLVTPSMGSQEHLEAVEFQCYEPPTVQCRVSESSSRLNSSSNFHGQKGSSSAGTPPSFAQERLGMENGKGFPMTQLKNNRLLHVTPPPRVCSPPRCISPAPTASPTDTTVHSPDGEFVRELGSTPPAHLSTSAYPSTPGGSALPLKMRVAPKGVALFSTCFSDRSTPSASTSCANSWSRQSSPSTPSFPSPPSVHLSSLAATETSAGSESSRNATVPRIGTPSSREATGVSLSAVEEGQVSIGDPQRENDVSFTSLQEVPQSGRGRSRKVYRKGSPVSSSSPIPSRGLNFPQVNQLGTIIVPGSRKAHSSMFDFTNSMRIPRHNPEYVWVVDINEVSANRGLPDAFISITLLRDKEAELCVVLFPFAGEKFKLIKSKVPRPHASSPLNVDLPFSYMGSRGGRGFTVSAGAVSPGPADPQERGDLDLLPASSLCTPTPSICGNPSPRSSMLLFSQGGGNERSVSGTSLQYRDANAKAFSAQAEATFASSSLPPKTFSPCWTGGELFVAVEGYGSYLNGKRLGTHLSPGFCSPSGSGRQNSTGRGGKLFSPSPAPPGARDGTTSMPSSPILMAQGQGPPMTPPSSPPSMSHLPPGHRHYGALAREGSPGPASPPPYRLHGGALALSGSLTSTVERLSGTHPQLRSASILMYIRPSVPMPQRNDFDVSLGSGSELFDSENRMVSHSNAVDDFLRVLPIAERVEAEAASVRYINDPAISFSFLAAGRAEGLVLTNMKRARWHLIVGPALLVSEAGGFLRVLEPMTKAKLRKRRNKSKRGGRGRVVTAREVSGGAPFSQADRSPGHHVSSSGLPAKMAGVLLVDEGLNDRGYAEKGPLSTPSEGETSDRGGPRRKKSWDASYNHSQGPANDFSGDATLRSFATVGEDGVEELDIQAKMLRPEEEFLHKAESYLQRSRGSPGPTPNSPVVSTSSRQTGFSTRMEEGSQVSSAAGNVVRLAKRSSRSKDPASRAEDGEDRKKRHRGSTQFVASLDSNLIKALVKICSKRRH